MYRNGHQGRETFMRSSPTCYKEFYCIDFVVRTADHASRTLALSPWPRINSSVARSYVRARGNKFMKQMNRDAHLASLNWAPPHQARKLGAKLYLKVQHLSRGFGYTECSKSLTLIKVYGIFKEGKGFWDTL
jgi:hypothetical protein